MEACLREHLAIDELNWGIKQRAIETIMYLIETNKRQNAQMKNLLNRLNERHKRRKHKKYSPHAIASENR